ncbi:MAG TPA: transposase, partial [Streptosporangiaceae bacterium]|nr:transposase [Streptosporangiaceae bacterium]
MLPELTLPASLAGLLMMLRPCFTGPSFATFCGLAAGLCGQVRRRTVCGMLLGAGLSRCWPHDRAHYFFARAAWDLDQLGLAVARLAVGLLVPAGEPLVVAVDDSVFRRCGRRVYGAAWQHDGSSPARNKLSFGTCFVTAGIIVALPFCSRPVCLPVLARLHVPGKGRQGRQARRQAPAASTVTTAAALVTKLAGAFPGRTVHVAADAHYHGPALRDLPQQVTWTTRLPRNAVLHQLAPPRVRKPGRPPRKGGRLGTPADLAASASWTPGTVRIYGRDQAEDLAEVTCLWYGCLDVRTVRVILARDAAATLALVTTDLTASPAALVERYAARWSIE